MRGTGEEIGQHDQRESTQRVVEAQQHAGIDPIGQEPGEDRTDDVEHADERKQARGRGLRQAVIVGGRNEMRTDQAVRARAADGESADEEPERGRA